MSLAQTLDTRVQGKQGAECSVIVLALVLAAPPERKKNVIINTLQNEGTWQRNSSSQASGSEFNCGK